MFDFEPSGHRNCLAEDWRILDFHATRAGRAVANAAVFEVFESGISEGFNWGKTVLITTHDHPSARTRHRTWDEDAIALLTPFQRSADAASMTTLDVDDPDADIVRWFAEQQSEVEEARRSVEPVAPEDLQDNQEVMLTRRNGSRSQRTWRGGGTMHRR